MLKTKLSYLLVASIIFITILFLLFLLVINRKPPAVTRLPNDQSCIDSFDVFAFTFPETDDPVQEEILPLPPWKNISVVPENIKPGGSIEVAAIRPTEANSEIWVSVLTSNNYTSQKDYFLVYRPDLDKWHKIPVSIENRSTRVERIFISPKQAIWGLSLEPNPDDRQVSQIIFSVFDDSVNHFVMQQFQPIPLDWDLNAKAENDSIYGLGKIILDPNGIFWIFSDNDAIYRFDPINQQLKKMASLEQLDVYDLHYDPNGSFFVTAYVDGTGAAIFQYMISTDELNKIELPCGLGVIDHSGNLWLNDAYAWRTSDGNLHMFTTTPLQYWWKRDILDYWRSYSPPDPFMESSDGRIWFRIFESNDWKNLRSGIAWFDPKTKGGCWFTSKSPFSIQEDPQHNLWMVVDGELYMYPSTK